MTTEQDWTSSETTEALTKAFHYAPVMMVLVAFTDWRVLTANSTFAQRIGYHSEEMSGATLEQLGVMTQRELAELTQRLLETGGLNNHEIELATRRGKRRSCFLSARLFQAEGRRCAILTLEDNTKRKRAEKKLKRAKELAESANRSKSNFLATMTHEIRTPMNAILGMLHLALRTPITHQQRDYLDKARGAADTLLTIINDLLDFSRIEAGKLRIDAIDFTLDNVLEHVVSVLEQRAREKGLLLRIELDPALPLVLHGDPLRLGQVLINLTSNAIKFTGSGSVVLSVQLEEERKHRWRLLFQVCDSGIGMRPKLVEQLFHPFTQGDDSTTRRYGGSGLGLSICKRLVELMGGSIWVASTPGQGSTFSVALPFGHVDCITLAEERVEQVRGLRVALKVADSRLQQDLTAILQRMGVQVVSEHYDQLLVCEERLPQQLRQITPPFTPMRILNALLGQQQGRHTLTPPRQIAGHSPALGGFRVLLVEDNLINCQVAEEMLEDLGIEVEVARNGRDALERVQRTPSGYFDLILLDIEMPVMDGRQVTSRLRSNPALRKLPIVAMTAHALESDRIRCIEMGMNDHIAKPIDPQQLAQKLTRWLVPSNPQQSSSLSEIGPFEEPQERAVDRATGLRHANDNPLLYQELLRRFLEQQPQRSEELFQAIAEKRHLKARNLAHSLKGVAATLGAERLQQLAGELERQLRQGAVHSLSPLVEQLREKLQQVMNELHHDLTHQPQVLDDSSPPLNTKTLLKLGHLLRENDGDAFELFLQIRPQLQQRVDHDTYQQLALALGDFRFDEALRLLPTSLDHPGLTEEEHERS